MSDRFAKVFAHILKLDFRSPDLEARIHQVVSAGCNFNRLSRQKVAVCLISKHREASLF